MGEHSIVEVRLRATGEVRRFEKLSTHPVSTSDLSRRVKDYWGMAAPKFVFETSTRERALVDSDFALRIAANAQGTLYVEEEHPDDEQLVSMSACLRNVLTAALHSNNTINANGNRPPTPPSPPLVASLFNNNASSVTPITPITSSIASTYSPLVSRTRSPSPTSRNAPMTTPPLSPPTSRPRSPVNMRMGNSGASMTREGRFAEHHFCTHRGVQCLSCSTNPICGTRYLSSEDSGSLCEPCRRASRLSMGHNHSSSYMVYDHPWESSQEYEHVAELRAPPAPLYYGDIGPKVTHLHFTLYTLGYLFLLAPGFVADKFNNVTSDAIERFQSDFNVVDDTQVYSHRMRSSLLQRIEAIEHSMRHSNRSDMCRNNTQAGNNPRLRLRSALAA